MPHPRFPKIEVQELRDDYIKFVLSETDTSVANALRRVMIAEIQTLAIDLVSIEINTSVMNDEFLSHRLGLIPLRFDGSLRDFKDRFRKADECDCDENCPSCSVQFDMDVRADSGVLTVTSNDLVTSDPSVHPVHFSSEEEMNNSQDKGITILKLTGGQRVKLSAIARLGIAKEHAKWCPVGTATFMFEPSVTLNPYVMDLLNSDQKADFVKSCPTRVFDADEKYEQVTVANHMNCVYCDECTKTANTFKNNPEDDGLVTIRTINDRFIFSVETLGSLRPEDVVICGLDVIEEKLKSLRHECLELKEQTEDGTTQPF